MLYNDKKKSDKLKIISEDKTENKEEKGIDYLNETNISEDKTEYEEKKDIDYLNKVDR